VDHIRSRKVRRTGTGDDGHKNAVNKKGFKNRKEHSTNLPIYLKLQGPLINIPQLELCKFHQRFCCQDKCYYLKIHFDGLLLSGQTQLNCKLGVRMSGIILCQIIAPNSGHSEDN